MNINEQEVSSDRVYQFDDEPETYFIIKKITTINDLSLIQLYTINKLTQQISSRALAMEIFTRFATDVTDQLDVNLIKALKILVRL